MVVNRYQILAGQLRFECPKTMTIWKEYMIWHKLISRKKKCCNLILTVCSFLDCGVVMTSTLPIVGGEESMRIAGDDDVTHKLT